nr:ATP-binding protein [Psychromonas sp. MB-3u-54]
MGDKGQLQQVFVNLFVNAFYAMDNNGVLSITVSEDIDFLNVQVTDTGRGMDKKTFNSCSRHSLRQNQ